MKKTFWQLEVISQQWKLVLITKESVGLLENYNGNVIKV